MNLGAISPLLLILQTYNLWIYIAIENTAFGFFQFFFTFLTVKVFLAPSHFLIKIKFLQEIILNFNDSLKKRLQNFFCQIFYWAELPQEFKVGCF